MLKVDTRAASSIVGVEEGEWKENSFFVFDKPIEADLAWGEDN
jgi:hypothetical protein